MRYALYALIGLVFLPGCGRSNLSSVFPADLPSDTLPNNKNISLAATSAWHLLQDTRTIQMANRVFPDSGMDWIVVASIWFDDIGGYSDFVAMPSVSVIARKADVVTFISNAGTVASHICIPSDEVLVSPRSYHFRFHYPGVWMYQMDMKQNASYLKPNIEKTVHQLYESFPSSCYQGEGFMLGGIPLLLVVQKVNGRITTHIAYIVTERSPDNNHAMRFLNTAERLQEWMTLYDSGFLDSPQLILKRWSDE